MKNNKPVLILAGAIVALFAISLVIRFVALSELGLPGGWTLYFGLPVGGIGLLILLLRLGLLNFGQELERNDASPFSTTLSCTPRGRRAPTVAPTTQRLQEIENLRASGVHLRRRVHRGACADHRQPLNLQRLNRSPIASASPRRRSVSRSRQDPVCLAPGRC